MLDELHEKYTRIGKSVDINDPIAAIQMPRGYGGTAIVWKKQLDSLITPLKVVSERIQGIEVEGGRSLIILSVYMPCKGTLNHVLEFNDCIDQLHEIYNTFEVLIRL